MFVILENSDRFYEVHYSGTLLETFYSLYDAEDYVNTIKMEIEVYYGA
jgi:hypothetical protein